MLFLFGEKYIMPNPHTEKLECLISMWDPQGIVLIKSACFILRVVARIRWDNYLDISLSILRQGGIQMEQVNTYQQLVKKNDVLMAFHGFNVPESPQKSISF